MEWIKKRDVQHVSGRQLSFYMTEQYLLRGGRRPFTGQKAVSGAWEKPDLRTGKACLQPAEGPFTHRGSRPRAVTHWPSDT